ncbi:expressed unknown protein [Ectocarpus siliculosus]|uniref:Uncharacterized protein n=1 Tax=Ectocarpus siliculosus TaxID=2880 RepID=D8LHS2_ECTSI|nr:expressed unknown protein [Ectocarpus siliculosus]|eukprot:CBN74353.1 expressed unknown protein [Ectocarpus siliculosus]
MNRRTVPVVKLNYSLVVRRKKEALSRAQAAAESISTHSGPIQVALGAIAFYGHGSLWSKEVIECIRAIGRSVHELIDDVDALRKLSSERVRVAQEALGEKNHTSSALKASTKKHMNANCERTTYSWLPRSKSKAEYIQEYQMKKQVRGFFEHDSRCAQAIDADVTTRSTSIISELGLIVCDGDDAMEARVAGLVVGVDSLKKLSRRTVRKAKRNLAEQQWSCSIAARSAKEERSEFQYWADVEISSDESAGQEFASDESSGDETIPAVGKRGPKRARSNSPDSSAPGGDGKKQRKGEGADVSAEASHMKKAKKTTEEGKEEGQDIETGKEQVKTEVKFDGVLADAPFQFPFPVAAEKPAVKSECVQDGTSSKVPNVKKEGGNVSAGASHMKAKKTTEQGVAEGQDIGTGKEQMKTEVKVDGVLAGAPFQFPFPVAAEKPAVKSECVQDGTSSKVPHVKKEGGNVSAGASHMKATTLGRARRGGGRAGGTR